LEKYGSLVKFQPVTSDRTGRTYFIVADVMPGCDEDRMEKGDILRSVNGEDVDKASFADARGRLQLELWRAYGTESSKTDKQRRHRPSGRSSSGGSADPLRRPKADGLEFARGGEEEEEGEESKPNGGMGRYDINGGNSKRTLQSSSSLPTQGKFGSSKSSGSEKLSSREGNAGAIGGASGKSKSSTGGDEPRKSDESSAMSSRDDHSKEGGGGISLKQGSSSPHRSPSKLSHKPLHHTSPRKASIGEYN